MAIAFMLDFPTMTPEQADAIIQALELNGRPPVGQIFHVDGPWQGGVRIVDVWESMDAYETFVRERLGPAFARAGIQGAPPEPQTWTVRNVLK